MTFRSFSLALLIGLGLLLVACQPGQPPAPSGDPFATATLRPTEAPTPTPLPPESASIAVYLGAAPASLDPLAVGLADSVGMDLMTNLFMPLTRIDPASGEVLPALAREWRRVEDGLTWQVFLRDDIAWVAVDPVTGQQSSPRRVTAADVVNAARRACSAGTDSANSAALFMIEGCQELARRDPTTLTQTDFEQLLRVRVLNDVAVEFRLLAGPGDFPAMMALPALIPLPAEIAGAGAAWAQPGQLWSSGPFALDPAVPLGSGLRLVASEFWPQEFVGNIGSVLIRTDIDGDEAVAAWQAGELALVVPPGDRALSIQDEIMLLACPVTSMAAFHYENAPYQAAEVRRAFALALDRAALIQDLAPGSGPCSMAIPAYSLTPPGTAAAAASAELAPDPQAGRESLSTAGFPACAGFPATQILGDDSAIGSEIVARLAAQWAGSLGCGAAIQPASDSLFNLLTILRRQPEAIDAPRPQIGLLTWAADLPDASHWYTDVLACRANYPHAYLNQSRPCGALDDQITTAASEADPAMRAARFSELAAAAFGPAGEMPLIPLYHWARPIVPQPWLTLPAQPAGSLHFDQWQVSGAAPQP